MPAAAADRFQVQLSGDWKNYDGQEDRILKRAFMAGFPNARYTLRGHRYEADFKQMTQKNVETGKARQIRPPYTWKGKAPSAPVVASGPTTCIKVPPGSPGTTIHVPHPQVKGSFIPVAVPATAHAGQAMLVPIPPAAEAVPAPPLAPSAPPAPTAPELALPAAPADAAGGKKKGGWSTGAKVVGGLGVAGAAVGGVVLGSHIAEDGWDATMADLGDFASAAGEGIADGAEAAVDWVGDAGESVGDFVMDLF